MGRWAQRRLRASAPPGEPAPAPAVLLSVETIDGQDVRLTFNGPVDVDTGVAPSADFRVTGLGPESVSPESPTVVDVSNSGASWAPGDGWDLTGQPNWLLTPVTFPTNGLTT